ncbi:MAG: hypothetical protein H7251_10000 [Acetobacteraceae bacterium]|nr:hypothetical protein [Acetobacteraceae bacterium]
MDIPLHFSASGAVGDVVERPAHAAKRLPCDFRANEVQNRRLYAIARFPRERSRHFALPPSGCRHEVILRKVGLRIRNQLANSKPKVRPDFAVDYADSQEQARNYSDQFGFERLDQKGGEANTVSTIASS